VMTSLAAEALGPSNSRHAAAISTLGLMRNLWRLDMLRVGSMESGRRFPPEYVNVCELAVD